MPTIVQTVNGKVTGLWGSALRRTPEGKLIPLKMGDQVLKGDMILTTQDGLVMLTPEPDATRVAAAQGSESTEGAGDLDRVIAELNQPDSETAPAAGLAPGDGSGLQPGLRVGRISEDITPVGLAQNFEGIAPATTPDNAVPPENQVAPASTPVPSGPVNTGPTASPSAASGNEDAVLPIALDGQDSDGTVTAVTIVNVPAGSTLLLADGVTAVTAGQTLTPAEAAGLLFRPAPDFNGGAAVTFTVTDDQGAVSAPASVQITVLPVNDTPLANAGIASTGPEYSGIPVSLSGNDTDGSVTGVTVTSPPVGGTLFLADGTTPVVPGTVLTAAQAGSLVFVANPGFTGPTAIGFTVTDNEGANSAPSSAQINVTPVPTTVTLTSSAPAVAEGGSVVYTASVNHPVAGAPLVLTLSNGSTITIPVGQSSASSSPVVPRADDAYAQGAQTETIGVTSTTGGNFSSLVTTSTVATTVNDDADTSTVSLSASAGAVTEGGSIVYTASVTSPVTGSPLTLTLSNGQTLTIPVGASSASSAPFSVRPDDVHAQGSETLTVTIAGHSGGNYEALATPGTATTTVGDDADASAVTLTASAATVAEGGSIVYTATTSSPVTGTPLVVTLSNGQTITIPVGQSSANGSPFAVRPDDLQAQGTDTVTTGITGTSGGSFEAVTATGTPGTTVTDDADVSSVTISASAASVAEGGSITYTATASAPVVGTPLVVTLSNGQSITIPVGASSATSAPFAVRADDAQVQGTDTLNVDITGTTGGRYESLATSGSATTTVTDDADATTVSLAVSNATVTEGGSVVYTATLSNAVTGTPFVVTLSNGQTITIPVGASSASSAPFAVRGDDTYVQGNEVLNVNVATTAGGSFEAVTATGGASTTVTDDADPTTATVSASAANVAEGGSIVYTVSLSNAVTGSPLTVALSNGQTVTIPVGQSSGSTTPFAVRADDVQVQPDDTLTVTITGSSGGNFEAVTPTGSAVTTVGDDTDVSTVSLSASATSVAEGGSVVYTASVSAPVVGTPLVITLTNGQTILIPVGQSSADSAPFAVRADDNFVQGAQSFSVGIAGTSGGRYEQLATASTVNTTVTDDADTSTVSLTATPSVAEGGSIVYTATLSSAAQTAVVVTLSNGAVINIAAGASSGTVSVAAPSDDVHLDAGAVSATIAGASGGNFESLVVNPAAASTTITDTVNATTVSLTGAASVGEAGTAGYTVSLTSPAQTAVTVTLTYGGTAANGTDFTGSTTVTIPAGASSATFSVAALDDLLAEGPESFTVAIASASGGNFESLVVSGSAGSVTTGIVDNDIASVSLSATPSLSEAGGSIVYTATLTQAPTTALTVTLSNGAVINVAAGALTGTVSVPVAAHEDVHVDPTSISATIASTSGGGIPLAVDPGAAVTSITDTVDTTTVSLSATPSVAEGGSIVYTATLTSAAQTPVTVTLSNGSSITIAAGATTGTVSIAAPADDVHVDAAPVSATITSASGGNFESLVVNGAPAVTSVTDTTDTSTVSLTATPTVAEGGTIVYTASLTAPAQTAVTVTLSNGAVITIAAGASAGTVAVAAPADDVHLDAGPVSATITTATGGNFENLAINPAAATTSVTDTVDTSTVSLTATPSVAEGGSIVYTASLTAPAQTSVTVTLSNGAVVSIAAGASSGSVAVAAPADDVLLDAGSVSATITSASGGNFENLAINPAPATTSVTDTVDTSTVSLTASPSVAEGGTIVYTASLTSAAGTPVTVTLSNGAQITIAAGSSSGTVSVPAPADDVLVDAGTVSATITGATGGNFENLAVNPAAASTSISDTIDTTTVSLTASPTVAEGGSIVYTASLTSAAATPVTVTLSNGATITIAAGASTGSVSVPAPGDDALVDAASVSATITSASGGNFENLAVNAAPATTAVTDTTDTTTLSLVATPSVAEGGSIVYTASLTNAAGTAVTVTLSNGATITIAAGASTGTVSVLAPTDDVIVDAGSVSASITGATGGNFENLVVDPAPATTGISDTIDTTTVSLTATPSVAEGGSIVYTASLTSPAGSAVTVQLSNGAQITIAAGASTGTVSVPAPAEDVLVDAGSVSATITSATGGNFENLAVDTTAATTTVADTLDTTTVSLSATPSVAEGGSIVYTASLTSPAGSAVTVTLSNGASISIAAGSSSGTVSVPAPADDVYTDAGSVSATITSATGGNFENLAVNPAAAATTVTDTVDTTLLSLTGSPFLIEGQAGSYTLSLTAPAQTPVTVTLSYSGNAADGSDFTGVTTVTIPAGSSSASFGIPTIDDAAAEGIEGFSVVIAGATGGNFEDLVIDAGNGSVTTGVIDNDQSIVSLSATPSITEAGGSIVYTATLTQAPVSDLTVTLSNGSTIIVSAGSLSGTVSVPLSAHEDVYVDPASVSASITGAFGGGIALSIDPTPATTAVTDTVDTTSVSLSATPTVAEGGSIVYTATLTNAAQTPVTVNLSNGQQILIAAGATSGSLSLAAPTEDVYADAGSVSASITSASGGNFESLVVNPAPATTTVTDTVDSTTVSLTATPSVAEGGTIVYTASLTAPAQTAVTVTLSNGALISIAVGASAGSVSVPAPTDDVYLDAGSLSVTIGSATGGNFESLAVNPAAATTSITDTIATTTVSLSATANVAEGGNIVYTASLNNPAQTPVTVTLSNGATITIAANASSGTVSVPAPADDALVDAGPVSATITAASGGNFENLAVNPAPATTSVSDTIATTTVSLSATPTVAEGGSIVYTASLNNAAGTAVTVTLSNGATITIAAGASTGTVSVPAPTDDVLVDAGNVSATISSATGGNFENLVVNPAAATTSVTDTLDTTTVSLTATPSVAEGGSIVYTASLNNAAGTAVTVTLSNGATITIAAGASSGTVSVAAPSEDALLDAGSVSATISTATGGNFENLAINPAAATTSVTDTVDSTTLSLTATPTVAEGGSIAYTASLTHPAGTAVTVTLSNGATITIAAGASSGTVSVPAPGDDALVDAGTVSATISSATGGNFESLVVNPAAASTSITDTVDTTTVSLTASASVAEGGNIVYTATLNNAAGTPVTVTLSNGAQITIAAGASTGTVSVPAPADDTLVDAATVSATISSATGGNFENLVVNPAAASTSVTDTLDTTTVSLTATPSVAEGGSIVYTASLTSAAGTPVTVTLSNGAQILIPAGASSGTVAVLAPSDDVHTDAGSVSATITAASGGNFETLAVNPAAAITSVTDTLDTTTVSLSGSGSVNEGASGSYTVSLTSPAQTAVTITLSYSGTAANGSDYTGTATVTIPAGGSSANFSVASLDDTAAEGAESFTVAIATATGGNFENLVVSGANGSVTTGIVDNDISTLSLTATPSLTEAGGTIVYTAALTQAPVSDLTVTLSNGSTITILAGQLSGSVNVPLAAQDDVYVDPGSVSASISSTAGGGIALSVNTAPAVTSITDTTNATTLTLGGAGSIVEGTSGSYTLTLTNPAQTAVTVTLAYTGTAANGSDYNGVTTVTIPAGASSATFGVASLDDALAESGESFTVTITAATGGNFENLVVGAGNSVTTAIVDEALPDTVLVSLAGPGNVAEGATSGNFTVSLGQPAATAVTVNLNYGGTAANGSDYTGVVSVTIPAGASSATFNLPTLDDSLDEAAETVVVTLGSVSGGGFEAIAVNPAANSATVSIIDNDPTPSLSINDLVVNEAAGTATFTVTLSAASGQTVTVNYGTTNGSATAGSDYTTTTGSLTFAPGVTTQTITVPLLNDGTFEGSETFNVNLSGANNATIADAQGVGTIRDDGTGSGGTDNDTPTLGVSSPTVAEGSGYAVFTVSLSNPSATATTVSLGTTAGTATAGADYTTTLEVSTDGGTTWAPATSATIAAGSTSVLVRSAITPDALDEIDETFTLTATRTGGSTSNAAATGTATLTDDDATPSLAIGDVTVNEADGTATFTVTLSAPSGQTVTVNYGSSNGTATAGGDYGAVGGTLTFAPGVTSQTVTVSIVNDTSTEASETFTVNLSGAGNATIADGSGLGTIVDNDAPPAIDLDADNSTASGTAYSGTFTENGSPVAIADSDISLTDVDSTTLAGATVTLTNAQPGDVLGFGTMPAGITASLSGNVVTLSGAASLAAYQTAIRSITFANTGENPSTADRTISVVVNDGTSSSAPAVATLQVVAVNDAPVHTVPGAQSTPEDTALVFSSANGNALTVADVDSGSLTTTLSVTNGTLTLGSTAGVTVTGNGTGSVVITGSAAAINAALNGTAFANTADYNGAATLTVSTSDGVAAPVVSTVGITVSAVADIANDTATTNEDNAVTLSVVANDSFENAGRTITSVNGTAITAGGPAVAVANGTVSLNASGQLIFSPSANYNGATSFTYTVTSGGVTETATANVTVNAINDAPVNTVPGAQSTAEDTGLVFSSANGNALTVADVDGGSLTTTIAVTNGTLTLGSTAGVTVVGNGTGSVQITGTAAAINAALNGTTFANTADHHGSATLTVTTTDGAATDIDTVALTVTAVADIANDTATTNEDTAVTISVLANDSFENAGRTITNVNGAAITAGGPAVAVTNGTVSLNASGQLVFTPAAHYNGPASFTYTVSSGGVTETATVNLTVNAVNDAPVNTVPGAQTTAEDSPLVFSSANGNAITVADVDGGSLTTTVSVTNGTLTLGSTAGVTIVGNGSGSVQITGTAAAINAALNGTAFANTADYNGSATLTVSTSDGVAAPVVSTVGITVSAVADIANDTVSTNEDTAVTISVLANDSFENAGRIITNVNGTAITAGGPAVAVANGTVSLVGGQLVFTPAAHYNGPASFTYTVTSGGVIETATVNVTVNAVNDAPVNTVPGAQSTPEDTALVFSSANGNAITVADVDGGTLTTTVSVTNGMLTLGSTAGVTVVGNGTGSVQVTGTAAAINAALNGTAFNHTADHNGAATLTVSTSDGVAAPVVSTIGLTVTPVADIANDTVSTNEDTAVTISVLANDSFENAGRSITNVNGTAITAGGPAVAVANGTVSLNASGQLIFTPAAHYNGPASFTYTVSSGGVTETATVNVTVNAVNDAPVNTVPGAQSTPEDTALVFSSANGNAITVADVDGGSLTTTVSVTNGTLTLGSTAGVTVVGNGTGSVQITGTAAAINAALNGTGFANAADYNGAATLTVSTSDGVAAPVVSTVGITVSAVADIANDTATTNEDNAVTLGVLANDSFENAGRTITSVNGTAITAGGPAVVVANGTVSLNASGQLIFSPSANYNGATSFTYTVASGGVTETATVNVTVNAVNDAPVNTVPGAQASTEDTTLVFSSANGNALTVADVDSGSLTTTVSVTNGTLTLGSTAGVTVVGNGTGSVQITGTAAAINAALNGTTFANTADHHGSATLTVTTTDGAATDIDTVALTVTAVADIANDTATTNEDTAVTISVLANDSFENAGRTITNVNGAAITAGGPAVAVTNGTVSLNASGQLVFTPAAHYNGPASFTYTVSSGGVTETATVNVTVNAVNDAPVNTVPAAQTTAEDTPLVFSSANGNAITIADVDGGSVTTTVFVTNGTLTLGSTAGVTVTGNATGSVVITGTPAAITAALNGAAYHNTADYNGPAILTVSTSDGVAAPVVSTVGITVSAVTDIANDTVSTNEDTAVTISVLANDSFENAGRTITSVNGLAITAGGAAVAVANGTVSLNASGQLVFTPAAHYNGPASFTYTVSSGGVTETATVNLTVNAVNDAPVNTVPGAQTTAEDSPLVFSSANGNAITVADVDGGALTTTVSVTNGTLTLGSTAGVTVTGNGTGSVVITGSAAAINAALNGTAFNNTADHNGSATLTVSTNDGVAAPVVSTVGLTVTPVVDIANDTVATNEDTAVTISVLANDSFENAGRTITSVNGLAITAGGAAVAVANGTVSLNASGQLTYTPAAHYNGATSFTYTVSSGGTTETATVNVTVNPVNDLPLGRDVTITTNEDTTHVFTLANFLMNDVEDGTNANPAAVRIDTLPLQGSLYLGATLVTAGQVLTAAQISSGQLTFVPEPNDNGNAYASFTFSVRDSSGGFDTAPNTATVNVTSVNDGAPVGVNDSFQAIVNTPITITAAQLMSNDSLPDNATITGTSAVAGGTLVNNGNGTYTFTPTAAGTGSFSYTLTDENGQTSTATVSITSYATRDDLITVHESALDNGTGGGVRTLTGNLLGNDPGANSITSVGGVTDGSANDLDSRSGFVGVRQTVGGINAGVLTVDVAGTGLGDYTYTLNDNVSHSAAANNNSLTQAISYATNTGTGNLQVTIVDDRPQAYDRTVQVTEDSLPSYNLVLVLDISGSMTDVGSGGHVRQVNPDGTVTITTRLAMAKAALVELVEQYYNQAQSVSVKLVTFGSTASILNGNVAYTDKAALITAINAINGGGGGTDYSAALEEAQDAFGTVNQSQQNILYFLSDGAPTEQDTVNPASSTGYANFVATNGISSYAVGIGSGISNTVPLDGIHNVDADKSGDADAAIIVPDLNELSNTLLTTVPVPNGGSVVSGAGGLGNALGADDGYVQSVTVALDSNGDGVTDSNVTFNFNGTNQISWTGGYPAGSPLAGDTLTLNAARGFTHGSLTFNFSNGQYTYFTGGVAAEGDSFNVSYIARDNDGDVTPSTTLNFSVVDGRPIARPDVDTLFANETRYTGNVISGLDTDGGLSVGNLSTDFSAQGSGADYDIDGARVSSIVFQGQTFSLTANSSGSALGGTYSVTNGQLVWTHASNGSSLSFNADGYYEYQPTAANTPSTPSNAPTTVTLTGANTGSTTSISLGGITFSGMARNSTTTTAGVQRSSDDGIGVTGGSSGTRIDNLETLVLTFDRGTNPYGVENVSFDVDNSNSNLGGSIALTVAIYHIDGHMLGTREVSNTEALYTIPAEYSNIGRIEITANSDAYASVATVSYSTITNSSAAAIAPEQIGYTLTDTDGDSSAGTLTLRAITNSIAGDDANNTLTGNDANDFINGGLGNDIIDGGAGHDLVVGDVGNDTLSGGTGNDILRGGAGSDNLNGGDGADVLSGGTGNDVLTGGLGSDVFNWSLADRGAAGSPAADVIADFNNALPSAGGDVLDLRDLLQGEGAAAGGPGNLGNYLHFSVTGGNTLIQISSTGGFSTGFSTSKTDQTITLQGVDLTAAGTLTTDQQIIQDLLNKSKLVVDGS